LLLYLTTNHVFENFGEAIAWLHPPSCRSLFTRN